MLDVGGLLGILDGGRASLWSKLLMVRVVGGRRRSLLFVRKIRDPREKRGSHRK